jgi:spore maturation protein CgeB
VKVTILGLAITSSWGNGHATNYRALVRALAARGDEVTFLERDVEWYAAHRDLPHPPWGRTHLYRSLSELRARFAGAIRDADLVIVGSFVPEGVEVARWVLAHAGGPVAFYDIDTPITLRKLRAGDPEYLTPELVERFDLYLSFTGGAALEILERDFGARRPEAFYCFVDPDSHPPLAVPRSWTLSYLGTYSADRQPKLERLLLAPARELPGERFAVAGPMYPEGIPWPPNVERIEHLPPPDHPRFYAGSAFTLNLTRAEMCAIGYSPSVRLFEAAACAVPVISDRWPGIETIFTPGEEIFLADSAEEALWILASTDDGARRRAGEAARCRVLAEHTAERRAARLAELVAQPGAVA